MATPNHELHVRLTKVRQAAAIAMWLIVIAAIVLIFLVGSQPSSPEVGTFGP